MNKNEIIAADSVWTQIAPNLAQYIKPIISYEDTYWKQGRFNKEKVTYTKCMLVYFTKSKEYWMHTGFIPRVLTTLREKKIPYTFKSKIPHVDFDKPHIKGITFRKDQDEILATAIEQGRGVIVSATGTGKSILIRGLVGSFNQEKVLFLVHTTDLVQQMMDDLENEVDSVGEWSGKSKRKARVMVATIQSFNKVVKDFVHYFDVVVVDECHHVRELDKTYGKTLSLLAAPVKFGFTATLPATDKGKMNLEALIGPVIANFSIQEAIKKGILAKPIIQIIKVPNLPHHELMDSTTLPIPENRVNDPDYLPKKYNIVYWNGIVANMTRNMIIIDLAEELLLKKKTTLVSVVNIEHGEELRHVAEEYYGLKYNKDFVFINGSTSKSDRLQIKKDFESKKLKLVIATTIWNEGVNIKSLNCCIIASGGKGRIGVIQKIGRGLRKTETKNKVTIYDFQDTSHKYLSNQFKARYKIYQENGWL